MGAQLAASESLSSDLFEPEDPSFIEALQNSVLPGDLSQQAHASTSTNSTGHYVAANVPELSSTNQRTLKRSRSPTVQEFNVSHTGEEDDTYGPSRFGEFGEYMRRKRAKLQIQNADIGDSETTELSKSTLFKDLAIYINGWTQPSIQDLRKLILHHGGTFHAYLDKKALVTHIITCSLTPAKVREFKHMKVVRPEWLVESANSGVLLPWRNYVFHPGQRIEESQGRKVGQTLLSAGRTIQSQARPQVARLPSEPTGAMSHKSLRDESTDGTSAKVDIDFAALDLLHFSSSESSSPEKLSQEVVPPSTQPRRPFLPSNDSVTASKPDAPVELNSDTRPLYTTDPATIAQAARVPGYAAQKSNVAAAQLMSDPAWRAAHTSAAPDFISGYYRNSRLHHLSTWKAELKGLVKEAMERAERGEGVELVESVAADTLELDSRLDGEGTSMKGVELVMKSPSKPRSKGKEKAKLDSVDSTEDEDEKVIMHCDFDCFFVSAGLVSRSHLKGKPVVVCHSQGEGTDAGAGKSSTSEIASCSYEARKFGVKNGMSLQQARKLCPNILTIPYEFERYKQFSLLFYTILMSYADDLQAVSVDEALVDVTSSVARLKSSSQAKPSSDPAKELAETIRTRVKKATGCEVSIGISHNPLLARLATRRAKPAASFHLIPSDLPEFLAPLDIDDLHGFGWSTRQKAQERLGSTILGQLKDRSRPELCEALGKAAGEKLYNAVRGVDERGLESDKPRKSVSCEINYGIRFESNEQAEAFIYQMADEVVRRMDSVGVLGRSLTLKIMKRDPTAPVEPPKFLGHGACDIFNKQTPLADPSGRATRDPKIIGMHAWKLLKAWKFDPKELRGIGIQVQKLESTSTPTARLEPGQGKLLFKPLVDSKKDAEATDDQLMEDQSIGQPEIVLQPPQEDDICESVAETRVVQAAGPSRTEASPSPALELPSFSQVDLSVFDALPPDVRQELEAEYKRRSASPALGNVSPAMPQKTVTRNSEPPKAKPWPHRPIAKGANARRITQQLAPWGRSAVSPSKSTLFAAKRMGPPSRFGVNVPEEELRRLDIDPEVFAALPADMKREQLSMARALKAPGGPNVLVGTRKAIKPRRIEPPVGGYRRLPPPQANHPPQPALRQRGNEKGEKSYFTETEDVQRVIGEWVERFRDYPPGEKDVNFFGRWLVHCVDSTRAGTDAGVEKAVKVMKWWLVLLRRYWGIWEKSVKMEAREVDEKQTTAEMIGRAWWKAFREVKGKMDIAVRKKFGGCLSLR